MTEALPCIVCGRKLDRVDNMSDETSPYAGTNFSSSGHYGSTVFDPMDGSFIALNVCDPCLKAAGEQGRVVCGRTSRPVRCDVEVTPGVWMSCDVGYETTGNQALVPWTVDLASYDRDDVCQIGLDDFEIGLPKNIHLRVDADELAASLRRREGS